MRRKMVTALAMCAAFAGLASWSAMVFVPSVSQAAKTKAKPNVLLIVADDLGYSDLGTYGGEIRTPNIDLLARRGTKFTDYYVGAGCAPTRAMLMSGLSNQRAGMGMPSELIQQAEMFPGLPAQSQKQFDSTNKKPGYEGHLLERVPTLPAMLQQAGYRTLMAGKWHLGYEPSQWPKARGFDRSFALLGGASSNFDDAWSYMPLPGEYVEDDKKVSLDPDFYSTSTYTSKLIDYIGDGRDTNAKPFFGYLAFTAPHDPLQVEDADLNLYAGRYERGYEAVRQERLARMRSLGLLTPNARVASRHQLVKPWRELSAEQKRVAAREMEIYAAMVEVMDRETGRLVAHLRATNQLDNTVIIFMSDNGAAFATPRVVGFTDETNDIDMKEMMSAIPELNLSFDNLGKKFSFISYAGGWSQASNGPFDLFKGNSGEGSFRSPLIIAGPGVQAGRTSRALTHVTDILPTIMSIAGTNPPQGVGPTARIGHSLQPVITGQTARVRSANEGIGWELFGGRAYRQGNWKIRLVPKPFGSGKWALYDLSKDPGETNDLSKTNPTKAAGMIASWDRYAAENGVIVVSQD